MTRGGTRKGAGRPKGSCKPKNELAKRYTFRLYNWQVPIVRDFIKKLKSIKLLQSYKQKLTYIAIIPEKDSDKKKG